MRDRTFETSPRPRARITGVVYYEREPVRVISLNAVARGRLHLARLLAASCSCPGCWA